MRALRNTVTFFMGKIVSQSRLVLRTQFYLSSLPLGAHQEETGILFWLPTKSELLDFNITVLNLCSPSGN